METRITTPDIAALVARLRITPMYKEDGEATALSDQAADALEALARERDEARWQHSNWMQIAQKDLSVLREAEADNARLRAALKWALGENGEFRAKMTGEGNYWWRAELRKRAALKGDQP